MALEGPRFDVVRGLRTRGRTWIGARLAPGLDLADCPLVLVHARNGRTLNTTARDGLAAAIGEAGLGLSPHHWDELEVRWDRIQEPVAALDTAMGGDQALTRLRAVLDDADTRSHLCGPGAGEAQAKAWSRLLPKLDPDPRRARQLEAARDAVLNTTTMPTQSDLGPWQDGANSMGVAAAFKAGDMAGLAQAAWNAQLRRAYTDLHPWVLVNPMTAVDSSAVMNLKMAVMQMLRNKQHVDDSATSHPLWPAVQQVAMNGSYDGSAHLEAAKALEDSGELELAWGATMGAAYFAHQVAKSSVRPAFDAARALAKRQDWGVITEHLDRVAAATD